MDQWFSVLIKGTVGISESMFSLNAMLPIRSMINLDLVEDDG